ncbi:BatD family protein [Pontibacter ramchanderi]|uniref:Oxygen tolerance protein BatD n=1 Tax=Pontibacter ramchanderi TaxID=1179743 RepID=A0A2N3UBD1_9BACT|nr:BatD family protein [Pontibacter ramchanderi]PKV66651.1 oxygen tolerance protein BatD [Pontibacter ramchanderi]
MRLSFLLALLYLLVLVPAFGQQARIELGKSPLPINTYFTVSIRLQDQQLKDYSPFPEIEGFKKSNRFSSTKTVIAGGKTTTVLTITQNYAALAEGDYEVKPFSMTVNGQILQSAGMKIRVGPMAAVSPQGPDLVIPQQPEQSEEQPQEYVDQEDNAFLTLYTDKKEVYVGEGLNIVLYFYLAEEDQRLLDFHDFGNQITGILRQLKQPNAWEEVFEIDEVTPEQVEVQGKPYLRFRLYEAVLYPLTTEPLRFPKLSLRMLKYKVAVNPTLLEDRLEGYKTFFARERIIPVKELPPHPLRDVVPVGEYTLREGLSSKSVPLNKSFSYVFELEGEGNLAAIMPPSPTTTGTLDFYPPDLQQDITLRAGHVQGIKRFTYSVLGRVPGTYILANDFQWIYFNPVTATYDTLKSNLSVTVTGIADADNMVLARDLGPFYKIMENEDHTLVSIYQNEAIKRYTNIILLVLLALSGFIFLKNRKIK